MRHDIPDPSDSGSFYNPDLNSPYRGAGCLEVSEEEIKKNEAENLRICAMVQYAIKRSWELKK